MKMITAIISPERLENVRESLERAGVEYLVIAEVRASAAEGGFKERYRGTTYKTDYYDFIRADIVVGDNMLDTAVNTVLEATAEGKKSIGRMFVSTIDDEINIATRNIGTEAIEK
jgi:nitrogen regulatory protein P-II 1